MNVPPGLLKPSLIVSDDTDGGAGGVQIAKYFHQRFALFESRFPVGSSASKMAGLPVIARATATSC